MCRVCPRPLKTHFYRKPAVPVASVVPPDLRARLETTLRRPPKIEKMENSQSFPGRITSSVWVPTIPEPQRDLPRPSDVIRRPGEGFGPIWVASSVDEDTSGSLPEFVDAADDVQSTGDTVEDGAASSYCDVGSPETAGGHLGCSGDDGSDHVAIADSSTAEAPERHVTYPAVTKEPGGTKHRR